MQRPLFPQRAKSCLQTRVRLNLAKTVSANGYDVIIMLVLRRWLSTARPHAQEAVLRTGNKNFFKVAVRCNNVSAPLPASKFGAA